MEKANVRGKKDLHEMARLLFCTALYFVRKFLVLRNFYRLFGSNNSPTTGILHTFRHVYRSVWPTREDKSRFGALLERSAHDYETRLYVFALRSRIDSIRQKGIVRQGLGNISVFDLFGSKPKPNQA